MSTIVWDEELCVGEERIDADHHALVVELDRLEWAMTESPDHLAHVVAALETHVVAHFDYEEQAMVRSGYEGYTLHKGQHDRFVGEFLDWRGELDRVGPTPGVRAAFDRRIVGWLLDHIGRADRALGAHLASA